MWYWYSAADAQKARRCVCELTPDIVLVTVPMLSRPAPAASRPTTHVVTVPRLRSTAV